MIIQQCGICNHNYLEELWDLPKLPFTEKYGIYDIQKDPPKDQKLLMCMRCAHVQLGIQISPTLLYTHKEYAFRTKQSHTAASGAGFFYNFFQKIAQNRSFSSLLDIGGNDLFLAKMVQGKALQKTIVDPICLPDHNKMQEGIKIIGKFIEDINIAEEIQPDLIFCRHVLEHIAQPSTLLKKLFNECQKDALYIFEIPCFNHLVEGNRFDAIFHQHYHYFNLTTFKDLISRNGGVYLDHIHYDAGPCGGSLLIAFQKGHSCIQTHTEIKKQKENVIQAIERYKLQMELLSNHLQKFAKNIYGYGASLMLATLAYHLKTDFSELITIWDDDEAKHGLGYENLPVSIHCPKHTKIEEKQNYLVTSLENTRVLIKKILELKPNRIIVPPLI